MRAAVRVERCGQNRSRQTGAPPPRDYRIQSIASCATHLRFSVLYCYTVLPMVYVAYRIIILDFLEINFSRDEWSSRDEDHGNI